MAASTRDDAAAAAWTVRGAEQQDLSGLVALERVFPSDRLARASFRRFLTSESADVFVAESAGEIVGDAVVVYRRGFLSARLYTIAVAPHARGVGVARALLARVERAARERGCVTLRLEVRDDNTAAMGLYERAGYEVIGRTADYYEDGRAAWRLRKRFVPSDAHLLRVPFYAQTLDFTCGPAALMMAMRAVGWEGTCTQEEEVAIWREATTVYMLAGHGGTSPHGLAVAARRRGVHATLWVDSAGPAFLDTVRDPAKKAVIELVHRGFVAELADDPEAMRVGVFAAEDVIDALRRGVVPLVLVTGSRLDAERGPHWVAVTGWDDDHLYLHDPYLPTEAEGADAIHLPVPRSAFAALARYGRAKHRAMVLVGPAAARPGATRAQVRSAKASGPSTR